MLNVASSTQSKARTLRPVFFMAVCVIAFFYSYSFIAGRVHRNTSQREAVSNLAHHREESTTLDQRIDKGVLAQPRSFTTVERELEQRLIKGAAFSAKVTIETALYFQDGSHKPVTKTHLIARDVEGRVRREDQSEGTPNVDDASKIQTVVINDLVARLTYTLEPGFKLARISPLKLSGDQELRARDVENREADKRNQMLPLGSLSHTSNPSSTAISDYRARTTTEDSLGKKEIEGVKVDGTQLTTTIPRGAFGNPTQIVIVEERWYSPELHTMVLINHSDPRFGDSSYRLTNISRTEPLANLFVVPADYKTENNVKR
jgi:hypothetical protein